MLSRRHGARPWRRTALRSIVVVLLGVVVLAVVVVVRNDFAVRETPVRFTAGGERLRGLLAVPERGHGPYGLVVFVHGDGPVDAAAKGFYRPMWESFAASGYASLSWSKPGVGGSSGNWLGQSMEDRAREVADAVTWAAARPDVDPRRIGLWGGSQAGWVMPKVAARCPAVTFVIAVSPAINWQRQGRYHLLAGLRDRKAPPAEVTEEVRRADLVRSLAERGAGYDEYRATLGGHADLSRDRWGFVVRNRAADATDDLRAVRRARVLLVLGGHDRNVDVAETERTYRATLPPALLAVERFPGAAHSMLRYHLDRSGPIPGTRRTLTGLFAPRSLFVPGYLSRLREYLRPT